MIKSSLLAALLSTSLLAAGTASAVPAAPRPLAAEAAKYIPVVREHIHADYQGMFRAEGGAFKHPFITPGSAQYGDILWDWD